METESSLRRLPTQSQQGWSSFSLPWVTRIQKAVQAESVRGPAQGCSTGTAGTCCKPRNGGGRGSKQERSSRGALAGHHLLKHKVWRPDPCVLIHLCQTWKNNVPRICLQWGVSPLQQWNVMQLFHPQPCTTPKPTFLPWTSASFFRTVSTLIVFKNTKTS